MQVFVAGATGVLGRRVVEQLVTAGHTVSGVARSEGKAAGLRAAGATPVRVELFDAAAVHAAVQGHDAVVNLATSIPPLDRMVLRRAWRTNDRLRREGARHLVDAGLAAGAERYVQESIAMLYADGGDRWLDEDATIDPAPMTASALDAEAETARFTAAGGRGVALRFAQFAGPDSGHLQDLLGFLDRGWLPLAGDHDGYSPFVDADDAAAAVVAALAAPAGTYNVAEDDPLSLREHAGVIGDALGRPVRLPPAFVGALPRVRVQARSRRVSNRRLRDATGWTPRCASMRQGWPRLLEALRREVERAA